MSEEKERGGILTDATTTLLLKPQKLSYELQNYTNPNFSLIFFF